MGLDTELMLDDASCVVFTLAESTITFIDEQFGDGYAKKNPQLLSKVLELQFNVYHAAEQYKKERRLIEHRRGSCN
jgi:hypothetical protein